MNEHLCLILKYALFDPHWSFLTRAKSSFCSEWRGRRILVAVVQLESFYSRNSLSGDWNTIRERKTRCPLFSYYALDAIRLFIPIGYNFHPVLITKSFASSRWKLSISARRCCKGSNRWIALGHVNTTVINPFE